LAGLFLAVSSHNRTRSAHRLFLAKVKTVRRPTTQASSTITYFLTLPEVPPYLATPKKITDTTATKNPEDGR
jgi:hypothetical protein